MINAKNVVHIFRIFEEEVRSRSPNILTDVEMDIVLKNELAIWLEQKVYTFILHIKVLKVHIS